MFRTNTSCKVGTGSQLNLTQINEKKQSISPANISSYSNSYYLNAASVGLRREQCFFNDWIHVARIVVTPIIVSFARLHQHDGSNLAIVFTSRKIRYYAAISVLISVLHSKHNELRSNQTVTQQTYKYLRNTSVTK